MNTSTVAYIYTAEDTTGFTAWDAVLSDFNRRAKNRARIVNLTSGTTPLLDAEKVRTIAGTVVPTGNKPPTPWIPVVWPRAASFDIAWGCLDELVIMGQAAAARHLAVHMYGAGDDKQNLAAAAAIVTALRVGVACTMGIVPVNVDIVSKYAVQSRGDELILHVAGANSAEQEHIRIQRALRKSLENAVPAWRKVALMGPFVMLVSSLSRGAGAQAAMAALYGRLLDKRLAEVLPEGFRRAHALSWVRSAILEEVWRGFPEDTGDMLQLDYMAQELSLRATTDDAEERAAIDARVAEYVRVRSQPSTRATARAGGHARIERVPVPEDVVSVFEDDVSEFGSGAASPYTEATRTPAESQATTRAPSPHRFAHAPEEPFTSYVAPPNPAGLRGAVFEAMRGQYVAEMDAQRALSPLPAFGASTPPAGGA